MRNQFKAVTFKAASDSGLVEAVFATMGVIDKDGDVTMPGFFGRQEFVMVPTHDWSSIPLGKGYVEEVGDQAVAKIQMNLEIPEAKSWYSALKFDMAHGTPLQQWSYGFRVMPGSSEEGVYNGKAVRFLKPSKEGAPGCQIWEVSPVLVAAGEGTHTMAVKEAKMAMAHHHTGMVDEAWDAGEMMKRIREDEDQSYYAKIFAWRDKEGDEGAKSSYKLPHHMVSESGEPGAANKKALSAAIAALNGARGGVDIPEADRQAVYGHLAAHMKDAEMEPPPLKSAKDIKEGKRFSDEAQEVLAASEALLERTRSLADIRAKDGRDISGTSKELLAGIVESMSKVADEIKQVISRPAAKGEMLRELMRFEQFRSGLK